MMKSEIGECVPALICDKHRSFEECGTDRFDHTNQESLAVSFVVLQYQIRSTETRIESQRLSDSVTCYEQLSSSRRPRGQKSQVLPVSYRDQMFPSTPTYDFQSLVRIANIVLPSASCEAFSNCALIEHQFVRRLLKPADIEYRSEREREGVEVCSSD